MAPRRPGSRRGLSQHTWNAWDRTLFKIGRRGLALVALLILALAGLYVVGVLN